MSRRNSTIKVDKLGPVTYKRINIRNSICREGCDYTAALYANDTYKIIFHFNKCTSNGIKELSNFFNNQITTFMNSLPESQNSNVYGDGSPNKLILFQWDVVLYPFSSFRVHLILNDLLSLISKHLT